MTNTPKKSDELQGEGNRTADQHYREAATKHAQSGKSQPAADQAKRALQDEGDELEKAEGIGKSGDPKRAKK